MITLIMGIWYTYIMHPLFSSPSLSSPFKIFPFVKDLPEQGSF